ncbi:MAG: transcriptional regulator, AraC family [Firmicutes bacterium]|nr:transcriptional regulator, AraC family [Bacillota bacterium]
MNQLQFYRDEQIPYYEIKKGQYNIPASKEHCHNEVSIGVVESGMSLVNCQGINFDVGHNHLVVFPPRVMHQCAPKDINTWKFKMLYIDNNWLESVFSEDSIISIAIKNLNAASINQIKSFFSFLESKASPLEKETMLITTLTDIFSFTNTALYPTINSNCNDTVYSLHNYLEKHYLENITLDEMTDLSGITKYHLIRLFQKSYAMTPHAYLMQLRINHAQMMLKKGKDIAYVAYEVGFYDQSHFSKSFKEYCGVTPYLYQKLN